MPTTRETDGPGGGSGGPGGGQPEPELRPRGDVLHVLVVEDDPEINELVGAYARLAGFGYRAALNGDAALSEVTRRKPDVIVLDLMLPDGSGVEVLRRVRTAQLPARVAVITATSDPRLLNEAKSLRPDAFFPKPLDWQELCRWVAAA